MITAERTPIFSVIIPAYNRRDLTQKAVESVLAQTFPRFEVIVTDDGSTDGTADALEHIFAGKIRVLRQPNRGAEAARHAAAAIATGDYLVLLDSDDLLYPDALETYRRLIVHFQQPPVILGAMSYFRDGAPPAAGPSTDRVIEAQAQKDFLAKDRTVGLSCSCIVIKRSVAASAGALRAGPTAFPFDGNDIMLALGVESPCVQVLRPYTVAYRVHDSNVSRKLEWLIRTTMLLVQQEKNGNYPGGPKRRFERRAYIGGVAWAYIARGLRKKYWATSLGILGRIFPMVATGAWNKIVRRFRPRPQLVTLHA